VAAKRILLVDDEDDVREVARMSLEMMGGFEVLPASSGAEALERAERERPDAIVMDVMMPGMDGPTTFRALRENPATRPIPVILLTAKVQSTGRAGLQALGVDGVLTKPFDPLTLAREVSDLLGWGL